MLVQQFCQQSIKASGLLVMCVHWNTVLSTLSQGTSSQIRNAKMGPSTEGVFLFSEQTKRGKPSKPNKQLEKKYIVWILCCLDYVTACKQWRTSILACSVCLHFCLLCSGISKKKCVRMRKPCGLVCPVRLVCNKETPPQYIFK